MGILDSEEDKKFNKEFKDITAEFITDAKPENAPACNDGKASKDDSVCNGPTADFLVLVFEKYHDNILALPEYAAYVCYRNKFTPDQKKEAKNLCKINEFDKQDRKELLNKLISRIVWHFYPTWSGQVKPEWRAYVSMVIGFGASMRGMQEIANHNKLKDELEKEAEKRAQSREGAK